MGKCFPDEFTLITLVDEIRFYKIEAWHLGSQVRAVYPGRRACASPFFPCAAARLLFYQISDTIITVKNMFFSPYYKHFIVKLILAVG